MSKGKLLAVCVVWLLIAVVLAVAYKVIVARKDRDHRAEVFSSTISSTQYEHNVTLAMDSFSGYAVLRSPEFKTLLGQKRIGVKLLDDGANYSQRIETSGDSVRNSGTAWRCMFDPINARFASSCSKNGIRAAATLTIWRGEISI